jgi:orotate phosphoribosyltransferase
MNDRIDMEYDFAQFLIDWEVIIFGEFKLKSGRLSPYFFNFGKLSDAALLRQMAASYAKNIAHQALEFDVVFGPAYKGIPLAISTAIELSTHSTKRVDYSFNRKEKKQYGEGGEIVGAELKGKNVIILDDVITSGGTVSEAYDIVTRHGGNIVGYFFALDRQEQGLSTECSAIEECQKNYTFPFYSLTSISKVLEYMHLASDKRQEIAQVEAYLEKFGVCASA